MKRNYTLDYESDSEEEVDESVLQGEEFDKLDKQLEDIDKAVNELYEFLRMFIDESITNILQSSSFSEADLYKFIIDNNEDVNNITIRHIELDYELMVNNKEEF